MDIVFIEGLAIETVIGCLDWERRIKQKLVFDIEMEHDSLRAGQTDELPYALDYATVTERITRFVQDSSFKLIEAVAENVAQLILTEFPCQHVKIRLKKPTAIPTAQSVGIIIKRSK